jgi:hypothetical protein
MTNSGNNRNYSSGKNNSSTSCGDSSEYKPSKKTLADHVYFNRTAKQTADYQTTTYYFTNHIPKTCEFGSDIAFALKHHKSYDMDKHKPKLQSSKAKKDEDKEVENCQFEIEFKEDFSAYMKQKQLYEANTTKAYALIWEQCSKGMQGKIEANKKFEAENFENPIELLEIIKNNCLNYQEHCYEMSIILDSIKTMVNMKQKENESLQDYTKLFKTAQDVMKAHIGGSPVLTKYVEDMDKYTVLEAGKFQEIAFNQLMAYTFLDNVDKAKYGTLLTGLSTQTKT